MNNKDISILTNKELYELRCEQSKELKEEIEFIEGVLVCSSSTSILHNKIVFRLASAIDTFLDGSKCDVFADGIEMILEEGEKGSYIKPDVFITCNTTYNKQSVTS
ncbi:MAG: Uma2 family endonuclease, partial [Erysipelotrichaceae bacterium]